MYAVQGCERLIRGKGLTATRAGLGRLTSRELLTSAMVAVMLFLADCDGANAKDRILCLHLIVCRWH